MMHEGDKYHESVGDNGGDSDSGDDPPNVVDDMTTAAAAAAGDRANEQREPRKFFPRVKMLLSFDYEPVRTVMYCNCTALYCTVDPLLLHCSCLVLVLNNLVCIGATFVFGNHPYRDGLDFVQSVSSSVLRAC
jgi:hypothetical protein